MLELFGMQEERYYVQEEHKKWYKNPEVRLERD